MQNEDYFYRITRAKQFIQANISESILLDDVASAACFSKFHFHRIFTIYTGETPADYIQRLRMEQAANILLFNKQITILQVAMQCGISSLALFSRLFKQRFGKSPTAFRKAGVSFYKNSKESKIDHDEMDYVSVNNNLEFSMDVQIRALPGRHLAAVTSDTGYNESISNAYKKLMQWRVENGLFHSPPVIIGISLDNPDITALDKCRYKACCVIPESITESNEVEIVDTKNGLHAVLAFDGSENEISTAYKYLYYTYLPENNLLPADSPCYELYHQSPKDDGDKRFVMDICIPVERMS